jgi:hypothetical protein
MSKLILRTAFLGLLLVSLAALPALAQPPGVAPGVDPWVTPGNGQTFTTLADGDVEALCGAPPDPSWNHMVILQGVPVAGTDYDTTVKRLDNAVFDSNGVATTRVQVASLAFRSMFPSNTPCGPLDWRVGLSGPQPVTKMTIVRQTPLGGVFSADLVVIVEMKAFRANTTTYLGSVFYAITLPQGNTPTPWSWGPTPDGGKWLYRPGITDTEDCIAALRIKLTQYPTNSSHYYFISDMIAQGRCRKQ